MTKDKDFTELETPQTTVRKNLRVGNLPEEAVKALEKSRMDERHASLNEWMYE